MHLGNIFVTLRAQSSICLSDRDRRFMLHPLIVVQTVSLQVLLIVQNMVDFISLSRHSYLCLLRRCCLLLFKIRQQLRLSVSSSLDHDIRLIYNSSLRIAIAILYIIEKLLKLCLLRIYRVFHLVLGRLSQLRFLGSLRKITAIGLTD